MSRRADWTEVTVEEIKADQPNALATGPFGSSISSKYFQSSGVPVIRGGNLSEDVGSRLDLMDLVFVSSEKADEFRRSVAQEGDLIFTCWGTVGQVGLIDERSPFPKYVISNKQMKLTPDPRKADSLFLYYLFSGPEMSDRIKSQAIGSSVPGFNLSQLRALRLRLPPPREQRSIAEILGVLDDKIELNRCMNQTLEAIARATFKACFVDPLHELPDGWVLTSLADIADFLNGLAMQKFPSRAGAESLPVIKIAELRRGSTASSDRASLDLPQEYVIEDGTVLFSWSGSLEVAAGRAGEGL